MKIKHFGTLGLIAMAIATSGCKSTDIQRIVDEVNALQAQPLDEKTVIEGLKKALSVGIGNTIKSTFKPGGFSNNALIKIEVPEALSKVTKNVERLGFGQYVSQFEQQMNRAAEQASGESQQIFLNAIANMSVADGWGILNGGEGAATDYFRAQTEQQLKQKFAPIITANMNKVGFYGDYKQLLSTYESIPFVKKPNLDIEDHIMSESLDGLFLMLKGEENKIRQNPAARTTELLKRVFGKR